MCGLPGMRIQGSAGIPTPPLHPNRVDYTCRHPKHLPYRRLPSELQTNNNQIQSTGGTPALGTFVYLLHVQLANTIPWLRAWSYQHDSALDRSAAYTRGRVRHVYTNPVPPYQMPTQRGNLVKLLQVGLMVSYAAPVTTNSDHAAVHQTTPSGTKVRSASRFPFLG